MASPLNTLQSEFGLVASRSIFPLIASSKIAEHVATAANPSKRFIIDVFAGAGGNAIAFAKTGRWERVIALEKDPQVFHCLLHNARVYGVEDYLSMIQCDSFEMLESSVAKDWQKDSVIFASPPWGGVCLFSTARPGFLLMIPGPGYRTDAIFDVSQMQPYSLQQLLDPFKAFTKEIILYLPRTSDVRQIAQYQDGDDKIPVVHYCLKGASKVCHYLKLFSSWELKTARQFVFFSAIYR